MRVISTRFDRLLEWVWSRTTVEHLLSPKEAAEALTVERLRWDVPTEHYDALVDFRHLTVSRRIRVCEKWLERSRRVPPRRRER